MAYFVSTSQPPNGALGDEWFNPSNNKSYKLVAVGGVTTLWQDTTPFYAANVVTSLTAGQSISITSAGVISVSGNVSGSASINTGAENTWTAKQTFQGNAVGLAMKMFNAAEAVTVSGISLGTVGNVIANVDLSTSSIYYYTTAASGNWNFNFRTSSNTSLNLGLANGESISTVIMVTNGTTPYYANSIQVDGITVSPKWQDGITPTTGNASSIDIYNYTIIKTSSATYTVLGSQSRFA